MSLELICLFRINMSGIEAQLPVKDDEARTVHSSVSKIAPSGVQS